MAVGVGALVLVAGTAGCDSRTPGLQSSKPAPAAQPADPTTTLSAEHLRDTLSRLNGAGLSPRDLRGTMRRKWGVIPGFAVSQAEAFAEWEKYRRATPRTGLYPLLLGDRHGNLFDGEIASGSTPAELLAAAASIDGQKWLASQAKELLKDDETGEPITPDFADDDPATNESDAFATLDPKAGVDPGRLWLVLLPTTSPWEAFAHLDYGGWNEYPNAEVHVAVMRYWHERFGAEPVIVTDDVIEMIVSRPPTERAACEVLAVEQFGYTAGDLVYQGYEKFGLLARALSGRTHWFFWWD